MAGVRCRYQTVFDPGERARAVDMVVFGEHRQVPGNVDPHVVGKYRARFLRTLISEGQATTVDFYTPQLRTLQQQVINDIYKTASYNNRARARWRARGKYNTNDSNKDRAINN